MMELVVGMIVEDFVLEASLSEKLSSDNGFFDGGDRCGSILSLKVDFTEEKVESRVEVGLGR